MSLTIERGSAPDPDRNPENKLTITQIAKLATYMDGGTTQIAGRSFNFNPKRETVEDNLEVRFEIALKGLGGGDLVLKVRDVGSRREYDLEELGIDLVDQTDPGAQKIYGRRLTVKTITFTGLKANHLYQFVFRGEEGGVAAMPQPRPVAFESEEMPTGEGYRTRSAGSRGRNF